MSSDSTVASAPAAGADRHLLVDLSLLVAEEMPCWWATHMPFQQKTFNYFAGQETAAGPLLSRVGPYQTRWLLIDEHTGTHMDAPAHFVPSPESGLDGASEMGRITADMIPLSQLCGPAAVVDVPSDLPGSGPGVSPIIGTDVLTRHEDAYGPITSGMVVLLHTGWDRHYAPGVDGRRYCSDALVTKTGPGWPAPDVPLMNELLARGVRCVGIDAPSMGSAHDGAPVHVAGLSAGAVYIEALRGLGQLPPRGAFFLFAPINLARGTGAPGRAMAWVPKQDQASTGQA